MIVATSTPSPRPWQVKDAEAVPVDIPRSAPVPRIKNLADVLVVVRALRGERFRIGVLAARVRVVGQLGVLDAGPDDLVQKLEVAAVALLVGELADVLGDAPWNTPLGTAPEPAVQRPVVVRVVADRVDLLATAHPLGHGVRFPRVQARVRVPHNKPLHGLVVRDQKPPEHARDGSLGGLRPFRH